MNLEQRITDVLENAKTPLTLEALARRCYDFDGVPDWFTADVRRVCSNLYCQGRIVRIYVFFYGAERDDHIFYAGKKTAEELEKQW